MSRTPCEPACRFRQRFSQRRGSVGLGLRDGLQLRGRAVAGGGGSRDVSPFGPVIVNADEGDVEFGGGRERRGHPLGHDVRDRSQCALTARLQEIQEISGEEDIRIREGRPVPGNFARSLGSPGLPGAVSGEPGARRGSMQASVGPAFDGTRLVWSRPVPVAAGVAGTPLSRAGRDVKAVGRQRIPGRFALQAACGIAWHEVHADLQPAIGHRCRAAADVGLRGVAGEAGRKPGGIVLRRVVGGAHGNGGSRRLRAVEDHGEQGPQAIGRFRAVQPGFVTVRAARAGHQGRSDEAGATQQAPGRLRPHDAGTTK
jgi:hypothetical protein